MTKAPVRKITKNAVKFSTPVLSSASCVTLSKCDNDFDETQPHEEIFYAFPDAASCGDTEVVKGRKEVQTLAALEDGRSEATDFQLLAGKALQSLEKDYHETVKASEGLDENGNISFEGKDDSSKHSLNTKNENQGSHSAVESPSTITHYQNDNSNDIGRKTYKVNEDSDIIMKAMKNIALKVGPALDHKLTLWRPRHREYATFKIGEEHTIIPKKPFLAFKKQTKKAQAASATLTRSATFAEAVRRLFLPGCRQAGSYGVESYWHREDEVFVIHCIGADLVECQTINTITKTSAPFVKWFHQYNDDPHNGKILQWPSHLRIELLGPCVPLHATRFGSLDLMPKDKSGNVIPGRLLSATVKCRNCMYHDYLLGLDTKSSRFSLNEKQVDEHGSSFFYSSLVRKESADYPNLVMAFNAGIWGYNSWNPTLRKLREFSRPVPFVITSYTLPEAEDDEDALGQALETEQEMRCLWSPEINPFASRIIRETRSSNNTYFENGAWQAYLMGTLT